MAEYPPEIQYFLEICKIPHPSFHAEKLAQFMCDFAKENRLEYEMDGYGNVIAKHPGKGPAIILQAHTDMVPQALPGKDFDFVNTPITPIIEGDIIHADGTTLGADDGAGLSTIMALLTDPDLEDVNMIGLFTNNEEVGLLGAMELKDGWVDGEYVINIDSGLDEFIVIGAAGAINLSAEKTYEMSGCDGDFYTVSTEDFLGGHSGMEIFRPRANAGVVLARLLLSIEGVRLASFSAGVATNAIPCTGTAVICVPKGTKIDLESVFRKETASATEEKKARYTMKPCGPAPCLSEKDTNDLLSAISECPHGAIRRLGKDPNGDDVVASSNTGIVTLRDGKLFMDFKPRGTYQDEMEGIAHEIVRILGVHGINGAIHEVFPAWAEDPNDELIKIASEKYSEHFGTDSKLLMIHAGLECSILKDKIPGAQFVSVGPTIYGEHTPQEHVKISSMIDTTGFVKKLVLALSRT